MATDGRGSNRSVFEVAIVAAAVLALGLCGAGLYYQFFHSVYDTVITMQSFSLKSAPDFDCYVAGFSFNNVGDEAVLVASAVVRQEIASARIPGSGKQVVWEDPDLEQPDVWISCPHTHQDEPNEPPYSEYEWGYRGAELPFVVRPGDTILKSFEFPVVDDSPTAPCFGDTGELAPVIVLLTVIDPDGRTRTLEFGGATTELVDDQYGRFRVSCPSRPVHISAVLPERLAACPEITSRAIWFDSAGGDGQTAP
jgi:hypothetical protein